MTKGSRRLRKNSKGDPEKENYLHDETDEDRSSSPEKTTSTKALTFSEKRDMQRRTAEEKRRTKMKCHLCGQTGHVRRECPGIEDDGRGESKFTKSNGDAGATILKKKSSKKGARNRGRKQQSAKEGGGEEELCLPPGFDLKEEHSVVAAVGEIDDTEDETTPNSGEPFQFFDAGLDGMASVEYLRTGRGKKKTFPQGCRQRIRVHHGTGSKHVEFRSMYIQVLSKGRQTVDAGDRCSVSITSRRTVFYCWFG